MHEALQKGQELINDSRTEKLAPYVAEALKTEADAQYALASAEEATLTIMLAQGEGVYKTVLENAQKVKKAIDEINKTLRLQNASAMALAGDA